MKYLMYMIILVTLGACCKAGDGGDANLVVYLKHHGNIISNKPTYPDTVMVKYKATEFPGFSVSDYDAIFIGKTGEDFVRIEGLKCGNYFLFGAGMDSTGPYRVFGGQALVIEYGERKNERVIDLAVVE